ncbi:hypothetical protein pb186bvf_012232 [Paramecium bursaria]
MNFKPKSQAQIIPSRGQLIFDVNQAYSAYSVPKIQYRQELPELPKVKPTLPDEQQDRVQMDKNIFKEWNVNYREDIEKRLAMNRNLKVNETTQYLDSLQQIAKGQPKKKTRFHKTKFRIAKNQKNQGILEETIYQYITQQKQTGPAKIFQQPKQDDNVPFYEQSVQFAEILDQNKIDFKHKFGLDDKELRRKNLVLEEVILLRLQKREKQRLKNQVINKQ